MKKLKLFFLLICLCVPLAFAGCENVGSETLLAPANFKVETDGIISFEMVDNAEYYTIMINDISLNVFPNADENNQVTRVDNILKYDASRIFVLGESYDVKVQAKGEQKASEFSNLVSYTHAVKIDKVQNIKFNGTILTWDSVEHANNYVIKIIAPYDKISDDSASNVEKLSLTEYYSSTNRFSFSSLTTSAGEYKFYINAISLENNRVSSGYTNKTVYTHTINLETPQNSSVTAVAEFSETENKIVDNYHLLTVVDEWTNAINVKIGSQIETAYLNSNDDNVKFDYAGVKNVVDINLSTLFAQSLNLREVVDFQVSTQAVYKTTQENNYYINSTYSNELSVQHFEKLSTPQVLLNQNATTSEYELTWEMDNLANVSGFAVLIGTGDGVQKVEVDKNTKAFLLPENFVSASVQAIGKGNYLSSNLSETATNLTTKDNSKLNPEIRGSVINWSKIEETTYIVEIDDEVIITTNASIDIANKTKTLKMFAITIVREGYAPLKTSYDTSSIKRTLGTPNPKFNANSLYVLEFGKVQNAIGYYVYLNGNKIQKLFTTNVINLANYLTGGQTYEVKVQAVADKYSIFKDGGMSRGVNVTHQQQLEKPTFILNDAGIPVTRSVEGNQTKYVLEFKGVSYANSYEILVNYSPISYNKSGSGTHKVDITSKITSAGKYTIMVRALPSAADISVKPSEYAVFDECIITEQLPPVEGVKVTMTDGKWTVSFDTQANAESYLIKIIKINDDKYFQYLEEIGLSNTFETIGACDISEYVQQEGRYFVYVTALAATGGFYANSDDSNSFAELNKLNTLNTPYDFEYQNASSSEYFVSWIGDVHADYFLVNVVDPYNISYEYIVRNTLTEDEINNEVAEIVRSCNISDALSIQGSYKVKVKAMVDTESENAIIYSSSPFSEIDTFIYRHTSQKDFERTTISMNGTIYNYVVKNIEQLKNILWFNYLYEIDDNYKLRFMLSPQTSETNVEMLVRLSRESTSYNFETDADWNEIIRVGDDGEYVNSDTDIIKPMIERLLNIYPELHILEGLTVSKVGSYFEVYYKNSLNAEKVNHTLEAEKYPIDYVGHFNYISSENRRAENTAFAIDQISKTMNVTTTEQLLHAVQYGFRPVFVGNCEVAKTVYENAKSVLRSIVSSNMTDLEKTTAIFDWVSYAINFDFTSSQYYLENNNERVDGSDEDLIKFGDRKIFYLEGVFLDLFNEEGRISDGEFFFSATKSGTSESYAKAFTLLCAIEGIETRKINANYYYPLNSDEVAFTKHSYNIVNLKVSDDKEKAWYVVDARFSDITSYNPTYATSVGSHVFFLVSGGETSGFVDIGTYAGTGSNKVITIVDNPYDPSLSKKLECGNNYNYYENSNFKIKSEELTFFAKRNRRNLSYSNQFIKSVSEGNPGYFAYNLLEVNQDKYASMEAYILNQLVKGYCQLQKENSTGYVVVEFRFKHADNNNLDNIESYSVKPLTELNNVLRQFYLENNISEKRYLEITNKYYKITNLGYTTCVLTLKLK